MIMIHVHLLVVPLYQAEISTSCPLHWFPFALHCYRRILRNERYLLSVN